MEDGVSRPFERIEPILVDTVSIRPDGDERAVRAVVAGTPQWFVHDGERAFAVLAAIGNPRGKSSLCHHLMIARHLLTAFNKADIFCFARLN